MHCLVYDLGFKNPLVKRRKGEEKATGILTVLCKSSKDPPVLLPKQWDPLNSRLLDQESLLLLEMLPKEIDPKFASHLMA